MKLTQTILSAVTALAMTATSIVPAAAVPLMAAPRAAAAPISELPVVNAQARRDHRRGFYRQGNQGFYNGHRGYRQQRRGYRQHNGWWFPAGAFVLGAIIGGALAQPDPAPRYRQAPSRRAGLSNAHYRWCDAKYRSYRDWDNSFQPY
ncbi:unnamed protein product, partial [Laminaria digitata]